METASYIALLTSLTATGCGIYVFYKSPRDALNKIFLLLMFCIAFTSFIEFGFHESKSIEFAMFWIQLDIAWFLLTPLFLHFTLLFTEYMKAKFFSLRYVLIYGPSLLFIIIKVFTPFLTSVPIQGTAGWTYAINDSGVLYYLAIIWFVIQGLLSIFLIVRYITRTNQWIKKQQAYFVLFSIIIPISSLILYELVFFALDIHLHQFYSVSFITSIIIITYAAVKYDMYTLTTEAAASHLLSIVPDCMFLVNQDQRIVSVNNAAADHLESSAEKIIGEDISRYLPDIELSIPTQSFQPQEEIVDFETWLKTPNGLIPVSLSLKEIKNKAGISEGYIFITRDITHRIHTEKALLQSETRYRTLFEQSNDAIILVNSFGRILDLNTKASVLFQTSKSRLKALTIEELAVLIGSSALPQVISTLKTVGTHLLNIDSSQNPLGLDLELSLRMIDAQQSIIQVILKDVTDRKRDLEKIQNMAKFPSEDPNPVFRIAENGTILYMNAAAEPLIKKIEYNTAMFLRPKNQEETLNYTDTLEFYIGNKLFSFRTVHIPERNYINVYGTDITAQKELENQLIQAQKMDAIGRLSAGIAHDFNNMLMVILTYSNFLLSKLNKDNPLYKPVDQINSAGEIAAQITDQLLTFSRKQALEPVIINLNQIIESMENMLKTITGETISLEFSLQKELKPVLIDPNQLKQCIINLALNARDSMPGGGSLSVATYLRKVSPRDRDPKHKEMQQGEYSCIKIEDTGHGMNTEVIEHIFEPFYTTKDQGKGTGLGLAMIYGFIKQSKGYIYAESVIGKGTAFYIYLPAA